MKRLDYKIKKESKENWDSDQARNGGSQNLVGREVRSGKIWDSFSFVCLAPVGLHCCTQGLLLQYVGLVALWH